MNLSMGLYGHIYARNVFYNGGRQGLKFQLKFIGVLKLHHFRL